MSTRELAKDMIDRLPEDAPMPDELSAIERANRSIAENGTVSHESINWD